MWFLLQSLIVFAVLASNVYWHWTPNGYLAAVLAGVAALVVTGCINELRAGQLKRAAKRRARQ